MRVGGSRSRRAAAGVALLLLLRAAAAVAQPAPPTPPLPPRPLLVTVDDLPIAGTAARGDAAARRATTEALLAVLKKHRVPAVAFVIAGNVETDGDRAILQRWLDEGHELGSHTNRHPSYTALTAEAYLADADAAQTALTTVLQARGKTLRWFRYPYLREGDTPAKVEAMRDWLSRRGQRNVPVTINVQDWSFDAPWAAAVASGDTAAIETVRQDYLAAIRVAVRTSEAQADALLERRTPQVLLLHANAVGAANWDALFTWLAAHGHRFATADEVMADATFRDLPIDPARWGYGHYQRLARLRALDAARTGATRLLEIQAAAWNRGDLETFCSVYAEDVLYASPNGLTRGRDAALARYRQRYPDAAARGTLSFEVIEARPAAGFEIDAYGGVVPGGVHSLSLLAKWRLTYTGKPAASGHTLLVFRPRVPPPGAPADAPRWEIVQDASM